MCLICISDILLICKTVGVHSACAEPAGQYCGGSGSGQCLGPCTGLPNRLIAGKFNLSKPTTARLASFGQRPFSLMFFAYFFFKSTDLHTKFNIRFLSRLYDSLSHYKTLTMFCFFLTPFRLVLLLPKRF